MKAVRGRSSSSPLGIKGARNPTKRGGAEIGRCIECDSAAQLICHGCNGDALCLRCFHRLHRRSRSRKSSRNAGVGNRLLCGVAGRNCSRTGLPRPLPRYSLRCVLSAASHFPPFLQPEPEPSASPWCVVYSVSVRARARVSVRVRACACVCISARARVCAPCMQLVCTVQCTLCAALCRAVCGDACARACAYLPSYLLVCACVTVLCVGSFMREERALARAHAGRARAGRPEPVRRVMGLIRLVQ
jgi:hypothetical protein